MSSTNRSTKGCPRKTSTRYNYQYRRVIRGKKCLPIRGMKWRMLFARPPQNNCDGLCVYDNRTLYIRPSCKSHWATVIHEVLHAALPDLDECAIEGTENALVTALCALNDMENKKGTRCSH